MGGTWTAPNIVELIEIVFYFFFRLGYFWQVTDFHYDANYSASGNPTDMCHQDKGQHFTNSPFGNYLCDAPMKLIESAIKAMATLNRNTTDFIIWTG